MDIQTYDVASALASLIEQRVADGETVDEVIADVERETRRLLPTEMG